MRIKLILSLLCLGILPGSSVSNSPQSINPGLTELSERYTLPLLEYEEHHFKVERNAGGYGINKFFKFLERNLTDIQLGSFSFKNTKDGFIHKFYFDLLDTTGLCAKIQSGGFYTFEFSWKIDKHNHVYDIWCRFDEGEKKPIDLDNFIDEKPIIIKYKSI